MAPSIPRWTPRAMVALSVLLAGAVLGLAAVLTPSTSGFGTHTQLGLSDCTVIDWTGFPCPMCGATTTFALLAHFRWVEGLMNQPFAALLFAITCGVLAISLSELLDPRARWSRVAVGFERHEVRAATAFVALMVASWLYKVVFVAFAA